MATKVATLEATLGLDARQFKRGAQEAITSSRQLARELKLIAGASPDLVNVASNANIAAINRLEAAASGAASAKRKIRNEAEGATLQLNRLRGSVTTLAASVVGQAVPGVTQLASAVGLLSLGGGVTAGVLAGVTAIGFAYKVLTEDARNAAKAQREAVAEARKVAQGEMKTDIQKREDRINELTKEAQRLRDVAKANREMIDTEKELKQLRAASAKTGADLEAGIRKKITASEKEEAAVLRELASQIQILNGLRTENTKKQLDAIDALELELEKLKALNDAQDKSAEALELIELRYDEINALRRNSETFQGKELEAANRLTRAIYDQRRAVAEAAIEYRNYIKGLIDAAAAQGKFNVATGMAQDSITRGGLPRTAGLSEEGLRALARHRDMAGAASPDKIGDAILSMFNPTAIATQIAANAISGMVSDVVDDLLHGAARAKEASRQWKLALQEFIVSITGSPGRQRELDQLNRIKALAEKGGIKFPAEVDTLKELREEIEKTIKILQAIGLDQTSERLQELQTALAALNVETELLNERMREDLNVRLLVAQGMDKEALVLRQKLEAEQLAAQGANEATMALLGLVQGLERLNFEAQQRAQAAALAVDIAAREAQHAGRDAEAAGIRAQAQAAEELASAKKLLDAGLITIDLFERLAKVLEQDVAKAIQDAADAAAELVKSLEDDIAIRELLLQGKDLDAALLRFDIRAAKELKDAADAGVSKDTIERLRAVLAGERALIEGGAAGAAGAREFADAAKDEVIRNVRGITSDQAVRLIDISRSSLIVQQSMLFELRRLNDGPSVSPAFFISGGGGGGGNSLNEIDEGLANRVSRNSRIRGLSMQVR